MLGVVVAVSNKLVETLVERVDVGDVTLESNYVKEIRSGDHNDPDETEVSNYKCIRPYSYPVCIQ